MIMPSRNVLLYVVAQIILSGTWKWSRWQSWLQYFDEKERIIMFSECMGQKINNRHCFLTKCIYLRDIFQCVPNNERRWSVKRKIMFSFISVRLCLWSSFLSIWWTHTCKWLCAFEWGFLAPSRECHSCLDPIWAQPKVSSAGLFCNPSFSGK